MPEDDDKRPEDDDKMPEDNDKMPEDDENMCEDEVLHMGENPAEDPDNIETPGKLKRFASFHCYGIIAAIFGFISGIFTKILIEIHIKLSINDRFFSRIYQFSGKQWLQRSQCPQLG